MKLLFVTDHFYPPHRVGGAEASTHDLALTLQAKGVDVAVLAALPMEGLKNLPREVLRHTLGYEACRSDHSMGYRVFRAHDPVTASDRVLKRFEPSAVVVTAGSYAKLARPFLQRGLPTILYMRDVEAASMGGGLPNGVHTAYVSNSRFNASRLAAVAGADALVLPPLVRPERVHTETSRSRVLFINPVPEKGMDVAFRLAQDRPDIPFDVYECWELTPRARERMLAVTRALSNVTLHRPTKDPRRMYANAKIVLVPSQWEESWARVVTEAHCSGIPVLASRRGGLPESVGPGGILVEHTAPPAQWAEALSRLWDDPATYATFVTAAQRHASRPEIQPDALIDAFIAFVTEHIARCRSERARVDGVALRQ
jgi:glycosyltransferase involved in cell wall biosynthesis